MRKKKLRQNAGQGQGRSKKRRREKKERKKRHHSPAALVTNIVSGTTSFLFMLKAKSVKLDQPGCLLCLTCRLLTSYLSRNNNLLTGALLLFKKRMQTKVAPLPPPPDSYVERKEQKKNKIVGQLLIQTRLFGRNNRALSLSTVVRISFFL